MDIHGPLRQWARLQTTSWKPPTAGSIPAGLNKSGAYALAAPALASVSRSWWFGSLGSCIPWVVWPLDCQHSQDQLDQPKNDPKPTKNSTAGRSRLNYTKNHRSHSQNVLSRRTRQGPHRLNIQNSEQHSHQKSNLLGMSASYEKGAPTSLG